MNKEFLRRNVKCLLNVVWLHTVALWALVCMLNTKDGFGKQHFFKINKIKCYNSVIIAINISKWSQVVSLRSDIQNVAHQIIFKDENI